MAMSMSNGMKMEVDDFSNIKMDPDQPSPSMADIDEYEDTGELIMPKPVQTWAAEPEIPAGWLLRIPKELWTGLADLPMDEEIHIGNVKVWNMSNTQKYRLELNQNLAGWEKIPKQYDMTPTESTTKQDKDPTLKNTFLFSEKNLPGFRRNNGARGGVGQGVDSKIGGPVKVEKPRQRGPRTIPKHTEMLGQINAEFTCSPRDNDEYRRLRAAKEEALKSSHKGLSLVSGAEAANLIREGMAASTGFATAAPTTEKKRTQENKATRMDEADLMNALTGLFRQYRFWTMAGIKKELKQPEAWLRQVLARIGTLIKTGQAANHWTLNETYQEGLRLSDQLKSKGFSEGSDGQIKAEEFAPAVKEEDADGDQSMAEGEGEDDDDEGDDDEVFEEA